MAHFDLVVRGGTVATAGDVVRCDIGIRDGRVAALAESLDGGAETIDAGGRLVLPGGIDSHCHIAQTSSMGLETADDFLSGTVSAACGGTTTIIPFAAQARGESLRAVVADYHAKAKGKAVIDYAFHLIVTDPTEQVLGQELPALIRDGLHLVQGVHDLRAPAPRRPPDAGRAGHGQARGRPGHGPRREPRRHCLARRAPARRRPHGAQVPRRGPRRAGRARGHAPRRHPGPDRRRAAAHASTSRDARPSTRSAAPRPAASPSTARPARSTCSSAPTTWTGPASRAPSTCAARRRARRRTRLSSGAAWRAASSRCSRPTTRPIASPAPAASRATAPTPRSPRSPTASPASSCALHCCFRKGSAAGA